MNKRLQLVLAGVMSTVQIPDGMQKAHGVGLDGKTPVESLEIGESPEPQHQGKLFVAAQHAARAKGYQITATRI